jgi:hypothetical protein
MTTCDTVSGRCGAVPCHLLGDCLAPLRFEAIVPCTSARCLALGNIRAINSVKLGMRGS